MRHLGSVFLAVAGAISLSAQVAAPPPQSARQALIEMFLGKKPDDFAKHLPDAARRALIHKGETPETSLPLRISIIAHEFADRGGHVETFDTGPNILVTEEPSRQERIEIAVEHDSLMGEEDEIEVSVHLYKEGQPQSLPVIPRLIFTLKQEKEVWKVAEVTVAAHVPLTDPDYLKGLRKDQDESNEGAARSRMRVIAEAEKRYAKDHPDSGYTCTLANLFPEGGQPGEMAYFVPGFANEEANGYHYALAGCDGTPAMKYQLTAAPLDADSEMKAFCLDESGALKSVSADKKSSCFSRGESVNSVEVRLAPE